MAREKILIVDDEPDIIDIIEKYLIKEFFLVIKTNSGEEALELIDAHQPDLIILDILLPDLDGISVCQKLRNKTDVPVLFLSCKDEDSDKVLGLGIGGDDYITKPFSPRELVARVKSHLRRNQILSPLKNQNQLLEFPGLKIDLESYRVITDTHSFNLPAKEFQLLALLAQNPNRVFSTEMLYNLVWNEEDLGDTRTVVVHISNLRKKIEPDPSNPNYIVTVKGVGYKLCNS